MNIYIFENIEELTDCYHSYGGAVAVANSRQEAKELIEETGAQITGDELRDAKEIPLAIHAEQKVYIFPNAGCC